MKIHKNIYFRICIIIVFLLIILIPIKVLSSSPNTDLVQTLQQQTDGSAVISYHAETNMVRFIGTDPAHPIPQAVSLNGTATTEDAARQFLATYGSLFGLKDPSTELIVISVQEADQGRSFVRFQQVAYTPETPSIPVLGGELIVQLNGVKDIISVNGEVIPDVKVDPNPIIDPATAQQNALESVAKTYGISINDLTVTSPELWVYNPALMGGGGLRTNALVWGMEVSDGNIISIKELVLVDAHLGVIALQFSEIETAKNRQIYDNQNNSDFSLPGPNLERSEGQTESHITDVDKAYDYAGFTYDFYKTNHNRDSLDGAGMALISTVRYCTQEYTCPYANAYWNGYQMVYGQGYASAADVVGHEMTHGVTDNESRLFYFMQSGAINESFSDIWGEFIDRTYVNPNDNWEMGEALPVGAIRSMSDPTLYDQPDMMSSSKYYCGSEDGGGVHTNSGVSNKAAYLMVAGGTFNGFNVTRLHGGMPEVAKIFYEVQTHMTTSASDYADLYDDLLQACTNLIASGVTNAADCQQVKKALLAVEMNQQPTACPATEAPICPSGKIPTNLFFDNLESPASGNWVHAGIIGSDNWYYPQIPNPLDFDATYATSGQYNLWGYDVEDNSDYYIAMTKNIAIPAGSQPFFHYNQAYAFEEPNYDGGVIEYSTDSGSAWVDAGSLILNNGYVGTISNSYGNPLGGRQGFIGSSNGYISSRLNLSTLVGKNVRFRFRIGTDTGGWGYGWFIDDLRVYTCAISQRGLLPLVLRGRGTSTPTPRTTATKTSTPSRTSTPTPTTNPQLPGTFYAVGDSYVAQGHAGSNYGNMDTMYAGYDDYYDPDMQIVRSMIQFDLSAIPSGTLINDARLNIYYLGYWDFPDHTRTITSFRINSNWTEMGVTWNNQPSFAESFGSVDIVANNSWRYVSLNITSLVQGWVNGSYPNYGVMLRGPEVSGTDSSWREFYTRNGSNAPQLVITYGGAAMTQTDREIQPEDENPINLENGENICQTETNLIKCFVHR